MLEYLLVAFYLLLVDLEELNHNPSVFRSKSRPVYPGAPAYSRLYYFRPHYLEVAVTALVCRYLILGPSFLLPEAAVRRYLLSSLFSAPGAVSALNFTSFC